MRFRSCFAASGTPSAGRTTATVNLRTSVRHCMPEPGPSQGRRLPPPCPDAGERHRRAGCGRSPPVDGSPPLEGRFPRSGFGPTKHLAPRWTACSCDSEISAICRRGWRTLSGMIPGVSCSPPARRPDPSVPVSDRPGRNKRPGLRHRFRRGRLSWSRGAEAHSQKQRDARSAQQYTDCQRARRDRLLVHCAASLCGLPC